MHDFYYYFSVVKSLHLIFIVSYFAGLFYIIRLFIYHTETQDKPKEERVLMQKQYKFMEQRLWDIITVPAGVFVILTGGTLFYINREFLLEQQWIYLKLGFVLILVFYHFWSWKTLREMQKDIFKYSSVRLRMLNEVATLLLFIIVFLAVLKDRFIDYWYWVGISFFLVGALIMIVVRLVNRTKK